MSETNEGCDHALVTIDAESGGTRRVCPICDDIDVFTLDSA